MTRFLENDLQGRVRAALKEYGTAERDQDERELQQAIAQARDLGVDPEAADKVKALRAKLKSANDLAAVEADVYDHLYRFFRRYYKDGDFISQRVYKDEAYAIPYQGEDVKLHWANADQYYIKTDEYLRNYSFRLQPDDGNDPMQVHFRLSDAAEGEHNHVKPVAGRTRLFVLANGKFASEEAGESGTRELVLRFEYRPVTLDDWPDADRAGKKRGPTQTPLLDVAERRVASLSLMQPNLRRWIPALTQKHVKASGERTEKSRLRVHLERYTGRNTFDYFIHKNLGGFLRRELDFYIKNEVMRLDDIVNQDAPGAEQYLSRIRAMRRSALPVIDFLASLENFQKGLWLKKKFVVQTSYCIRLGCIPDEFLPQIAANDAQRREWVELCGIDALKGDLAAPGYSEPLRVEFLRTQPALMADTRHFKPAFAERLIEATANAPNACLLVHGENFQSLNILSRCFRGEINCVYIDPPYNAPASEILYKNNFKHSSFLSMIESRLLLSRHLTAADGSHVVAIDKNERNGVFRLLSQTFPHHDNVAITVEHNRKGVQDQKFSFTHEYALFSIPPARKTLNQVERQEDQWTYDNFRNWGGESRREDGASTFYSVRIRDGEILDFGDVWVDEGQHPEGANVPRPDGIIEVFPIDADGVERKWRYEKGTVDSIRHKLKVVKNRAGLWDIKVAKTRDQRKTVWYGAHYNAGDHGTKLLGHMGFPKGSFDNPKSVFNVQDCVDSVSDGHHVILDYYAGSGTTGHAVINLNREDGGDRRFILVEMGEHFDTVLVPRLKKVIYSPEWKDGKPVRKATEEETEHAPGIMKVIRLESYEDTLNNLQVPTAEAEGASRPSQRYPLQPPGSEASLSRQGERHLLRYLLGVELPHGTSLLDVERFVDPTAYTLKVKRPGSDETRETPVDLIETFNWLLGLRVSRFWAPRQVDAHFKRDKEGRLKLRTGLQEAPDGQWWFRAVEGLLPDDRRALVIWRKRPGGDTAEGTEQDNLVLNEWFDAQGWADMPDRDRTGFDVVYANGDHNLQNIRPAGASWTTHLLEEHFFRLMFEDDEQT